MTSKALGMAMIQQYLSFQIINQNMCGVALESTILDLNEAIHLGEMVQGMSMKDIMNLFKQKNQKIVILQAGSVGHDISLERFRHLGTVISYDDTKQEEVRERILDANIVITNKNMMNEDVLHGLDNLKLICLFATGVNNINLDYCKEHGIKVANVKDIYRHSCSTYCSITYALSRKECFL